MKQVIAIVNDYEITEHEYQVERLRTQKKMRLDEPNDECCRRAIESLIDGILLLQEVRRSETEVTPDEVQCEMLDLMMEFESEEEFDGMLATQGLSIAIIRERMADHLLIQKYTRQRFAVTPDQIPEDKLRAFYDDNQESFITPEMVKASHVLIKDPGDEQLRIMKEIMTDLTDPMKEFGEIAELLSDCPSYMQSGDLGWLSRGCMVPEIEEAVFSLEVGQLSEPVQTKFGVHILLVTGKRRQQVAPFEELRDALRERLLQIESELRLIRHLKTLRQQANIEILQELN
ncbi:MAG: peptidylprolyl isomerase [Candidatus Cloacimonetes bacterium]|nr:peptidylprolyl isomerase [Candidatus Cloacimonadota bacterium]